METVILDAEISIIYIRQLYDYFILIIGILILVRWCLYRDILHNKFKCTLTNENIRIVIEFTLHNVLWISIQGK